MGVTRPALIVPDEGTWLLWGHDLRASGLHQVLSPASATTLVAPSRVPVDLLPALREVWDRMPRGRELVCLDARISGEADTRQLLAHERRDHGEHEGNHEHHDDHGAHDHHAMMAVTGEPSADGLVMEDLAVTLGPVASPLAAGLVAHLTLDGDVVCTAHLEPSFAEPDSLVPDPTTPAAWAAALDVAGGDATSWIPDVEHERALSHARFFMSLGTLLGWPQLTERALELARVLHASPGDRVAEHALPAAERLVKLVRSRRLRLRLRGIAIVERGKAEESGLTGPNARASGVVVDARVGHGTYEALDFRPVLEDSGDALARAHVRAHEIVDSLELLARWSGRTRAAAAAPAAVEGPRGPVTIRPVELGHAAEMASPGQGEALRAAADSVHRLEWSDAIVAVHSFDVSGWRIA